MKNKIKSIYKNRKDFIVIGLTGKTGSGCSTVADILKNGYKEYNPVDCNLTDIQSRKAEIIKKFASKNFIDDDKKFKIIKPSTILIMLFIFDNKIIIEKIASLFESLDKTEENLKKEIIELKEIKKIAEILNKDVELFKEFFKFIDLIDIENSKNKEDDILKEIKKVKELYEKKLKLESKEDLEKEIKTILGTKNNIKLKKYRLDFNEYKTIDENSTDKKIIKDKIDLKREIFNDFIKKYSKQKSKRFIKLYTGPNEKIQKLREEKKLSTKDLQLIGDLVREYVDIYQLPNYCNYLIKAYRNESKNKSCYIAIDSLKNPFEIVFFKERYSAYYTFSIHSKDETIERRLKDLGYSSQEIEGIHKKEQNQDERIVLISRENKGLPYSLNEGISIAKGAYIARMDADDISLPTRFEKQIDYMRKNKLDVCGSYIKLFGDNRKELIIKNPITNEDIRFLLLFFSSLAHPTVVFKKEVFTKVKYNIEYRVAQDYQLWCDIANANFKIGNIPEMLLNYREHEAQASIEKFRSQQDTAHKIALYYAKNLGNEEIKLVNQIIASKKNIGIKELKKLFYDVKSYANKKSIQNDLIFYILKKIYIDSNPKSPMKYLVYRQAMKNSDKQFKEELILFLKSFIIFSRNSKIYQFLKRLKNNAK